MSRFFSFSPCFAIIQEAHVRGVVILPTKTCAEVKYYVKFNGFRDYFVCL